MTDNDEPIRCERQRLNDAPGTAAIITLNRPALLNAINLDVIEALDQALNSIEADGDVRSILVTGAGRAFSAGGDLKGYVELQRDAAGFPHFLSRLHTVFGRLRTMRIPVVALVNGVTAAGGLELLIGCDVALAAESATIGDAHLNFGQMGGGGVLTLLPRIVGIQRATELVMSGRFLSSAEASEWGLVSRVVPDTDLLNEGLAFANLVAAKSPLAVANAKYVMASIWAESMSVAAGLRLERERNAFYCLTSKDAPEGLQAFSEHRLPRFTGQ